MVTKKGSREFLLWLGIITLGVYLRARGLTWGLPGEEHGYSFHPDEFIILRSLGEMSWGDYNPHYFTNPSAYIYCVGIILFILKSFSLVQTIGVQGSHEELWLLLFVGRIMTVTCGVISIPLLYGIAQRLFDNRTALWSTLFFTILPLHVVHSHYLTVEICGVFWILCCVWIYTGTNDEGTIKQWLLCGLAGGLAASTKYTGIVVFPVLATILILAGRSRLLSKKLTMLILFFLSGAIGFVLGTPYSLLSPLEFIRSLFGMFRINLHASEYAYPLSDLFLFSVGGPLLCLVVAGTLVAAAKRSRGDVLFLLFLCVLLPMIYLSGTPFTRHLIVLSPFLALCAGRAANHFHVTIQGLGRNRLSRILPPAIVMVFVVWTAGISFGYVEFMSQTDIRLQAADWIKSEITFGSSLGVAAVSSSIPGWFYTPPVPWDKYRVKTIRFSSRHLLADSPDYFILTDFESRESSYIRRFFAPDYGDSELFIEMLGSPRYRIVREFKRYPYRPFTSGKGNPPHDWMYPYPTITILKKNTTGDKHNAGAVVS